MFGLHSLTLKLKRYYSQKDWKAHSVQASVLGIIGQPDLKKSLTILRARNTKSGRANNEATKSQRRSINTI